MCKTVALITMFFMSSCAFKHNVDVAQQPIEKPEVEFAKELLEKPEIITNDKCYLVNSPKVPVICMLPTEFDKETRNYKIMLDILKQYQVSDKYYNSVK